MSGGMVQEDGSSVSSSPLQFFPWMALSPAIGSPEDRGMYLFQLLRACAHHVAAGNLENANTALEHISHLASTDGDQVQRIAAYFNEAFADRMLKSWTGLHNAFNSTKISSISEKIQVQRMFFELCPFLKLAYVVTNQAIVDAMEGEKMVHILDLNSCEPLLWINLLQTLSARPEGPPHLRITGIHEQKEVLEQVALHLTEEAEKLDIPFQFIPVISKLENLDVEALRVKTGEALAISSVLQMHTLLAVDDETSPKNSNPNSNHLARVYQMNQRTLGEWLEKDLMHMYDSPSPSSPFLTASAKMGSFLSALCGLCPKVMVMTEQEANHNGSTFIERAMEALGFYATLFDCLESTVPRTSLQRQKVEKMRFGEEIKSIIACEGGKRVERHEKLEKWTLRLEQCGFGRVGLSYHAMLQARRMLQQSYGAGYHIKEENGCLIIFWNSKPLFSISAWRFRSSD